jgi:hypothetical protein
MPIHLVHPKFLNDELLRQEHDFLHELYDSLADGGKGVMGHPDLFRFKEHRGQLYIRHRKIVEELGIRGIVHDTLIDRRAIGAEEWKPVDVTEEKIVEEAGQLRGGVTGRVPLPDTTAAADFTCPDDISSVIAGTVELDILRALWKIYRHVVMERSYSRYRTLQDPLQGRGRGSVWMLFDLMMEEAFAQVPEERAPAIAYETMWESLEDNAGEGEKQEYARLAGELKPGKVSLDMRRFLAAEAQRQGSEDLTVSALLAPYIE